jgi:hypothetical protein
MENFVINKEEIGSHNIFEESYHSSSVEQKITRKQHRIGKRKNKIDCMEKKLLSNFFKVFSKLIIKNVFPRSISKIPEDVNCLKLNQGFVTNVKKEFIEDYLGQSFREVFELYSKQKDKFKEVYQRHESSLKTILIKNVGEYFKDYLVSKHFVGLCRKIRLCSKTCPTCKDKTKCEKSEKYYTKFINVSQKFLNRHGFL